MDVLLAALALATGLAWHQALRSDAALATIPVAVTGSEGPSPLEFDPRSVDPANTLPGRYGDFAVIAPDGTAHLTYDFGERRRFDAISHRYDAPAPDPWYQISALELLVGDDGVNWTSVSRAQAFSPVPVETITEGMPAERRAARDQAAEIVFDARDAGAHRFWRLVVARSGLHRIAIFDQVAFTPPLPWTARVPLEAPIALGALLLARLARRAGAPAGGAAIAAGTAAALAYLAILALATPAWPLIFRDSQLYLALALDGTPSAFVPPGYPVLVAAMAAAGPHVLPVAQTLALLAGVAVSAVAAARIAGAAAAAVFVSAMGAVWGIFVVYAHGVLTEAPFTAGLLLAAAGLALSAHERSRAAFLLAGLGLGVAMLSKSVAPVLLAPAAMTLRFLPRDRWLTYATCALAPPVAVLVAMSAYMHVHADGVLGVQLGPIAMLGQVAPYASPSPAADGEVAAIETAIAEALAAAGIGDRPRALADLVHASERDRLVDEGSLTYSPMLDVATGALLRVLEYRDPARYADLEARAAWRSAAMTEVSIEILRKNPARFSLHVLTQFVGLWRDLGREGVLARNSLAPLPTIDRAAVFLRANTLAIDALLDTPFVAGAAEALGPRPTRFEATAAAARRSLLATVLPDLGRHALFSLRDGWELLMALGLGLSTLWLAPAAATRGYAGAITVALLVNAYFLGHALFQVTLGRYAHVALPAVLFMTILFAAVTIRRLAEAARRGGRSDLRFSASVA